MYYYYFGNFIYNGKNEDKKTFKELFEKLATKKINSIILNTNDTITYYTITITTNATTMT